MRLLRGYVRELLREARWDAVRKPMPGEPSTYKVHGYHTTVPEHWASIRKKGLVPGLAKPAGQDWLGAHSGKAIYYHQTLPLHELDAAAQGGDQLELLTLEVSFSVYAGYVVPDEEAGEAEDTPTIMAEKGPIAVFFPCKPNGFVALHLPDVPAAHRWADEEAHGMKVVYHAV